MKHELENLAEWILQQGQDALNSSVHVSVILHFSRRYKIKYLMHELRTYLENKILILQYQRMEYKFLETLLCHISVTFQFLSFR